MKTLKAFGFLGLVVVLGACKEERLPILGETSTHPVTGELVYYKAPDFQLTNQLNSTVSSGHIKGKIQVVDFFFTSCPTICPQMTNHLKLVETAFKDNDDVRLISYSIDPKTDTPKQLKSYADAYAINNEKWNLLTGESEVIFELAKDYKVRAFDDSTPDNDNNLLHDGTFVLVDGASRIRGYYNGLEVADTQRLINDINILLKE